MPMKPVTVRATVVSALVLAFAACSSSAGTTSGAGPSASSGGGDDGGAASEDDGGEATEGGVSGGGAGPFDLSLTVRELRGGTPADNLFFVAVRDADTSEVVATSHDEEHTTQTFKLSKKRALTKGHRYEVGIKTTWPTDCLASTTDVWYREIPEVTANVALSFDVTEGVDVDTKGCDVLHVPVALPPGTYTADVPVAGVSGNHVTLEVSPTGRVYTRSMQIFCGATSGCVSTTVTHGVCELEQATYPDADSFSLGDESGSSTAVKGTATIDASAKTIHYVGSTTTWKSGGGSQCCTAPFDVVLKKTSSAVQCK